MPALWQETARHFLSQSNPAHKRAQTNNTATLATSIDIMRSRIVVTSLFRLPEAPVCQGIRLLIRASRMAHCAGCKRLAEAFGRTQLRMMPSGCLYAPNGIWTLKVSYVRGWKTEPHRETSVLPSRNFAMDFTEGCRRMRGSQRRDQCGRARSADARTPAMSSSRTAANSPGRSAASPRHSFPWRILGIHQQPPSTA